MPGNLPSTNRPLFPLTARLFSLWSFVADSWHRARYRRAELRRIPAASRGGAAAPQWDLSQPRVAVLTAPAGTGIVYHVTLPAGARIETRCAVRRDPAGLPVAQGSSDSAPVRVTPGSSDPGGRARVEFRIEVEAAGKRWTAVRQVASATSPFGRRSRSLRLTIPEGGAATIVLASRVLGQEITTAIAAWINPRVASPRPVAELFGAVRAAAAGGIARVSGAAPGSDRVYQLWAREQEPSRRLLQRQREWAETQSRLFTLITDVADPASWRDGATATSVLRQSYPRWEWLLVVPEGTRFDRPPLNGDQRVRIITIPPGSSRAQAWSVGLREARGEMAGLFAAGDTLSPSALYQIASTREQHGEVDLIYSDEDRIDLRGRRTSPRFKPEWSPDLLLATGYVGRLAMLRVAAASALGGFREEFSGAEEWDLLLRLSRSSPRVRRVTQCLYHRHHSGAEGESAGAAAVRDHLSALDLTATSQRAGSGDPARVSWSVRGDPLVSIIIPNRNAASVLATCLHGLLNGTPAPRREIIIVDNGSTDAAVFEMYQRLEQDGAGRIVPFTGPFNYSAACNAGAAAASGELLLFLNNDIEVVEPGWLEELSRWAQRPEIGVVGAKLLYPDRLIQHAGVAFGIGLVGHLFARAPERTSGVFGSTETYRNCIAVTGACQMMRRDVFERLRGYDERYRLTFSDVVLCMEAWKAGYRVVYTPYARLIHHESYTRQRDESPEDMDLLAGYLRDTGFTEDPYFHPHLDPKSPVPVVRPPFEPSPRQVIADYVERVLAAGRLRS